MTTPTPEDDAETAERLIQSWIDEYAARGSEYAVVSDKLRERWGRIRKLTPAEANDLSEWMLARSNATTEATMDDHRLAVGFYSMREDYEALGRWLKAKGYR